MNRCVRARRFPARGVVLGRERTITGGLSHDFNGCAWAAGLFEGEGCVNIRRTKQRSGNPGYSLACVVKMSDREPLERLQGAWSGRIYPVPVKGNRRPMCMWVVMSRQAAAFLEGILPYFASQRARDRAELALTFQAQKFITGRGVTAEYRERQESYYWAMRRLNSMGLAALSAEERRFVVDTRVRAAIEEQLPLLRLAVTPVFDGAA